MIGATNPAALCTGDDEDSTTVFVEVESTLGVETSVKLFPKKSLAISMSII